MTHQADADLAARLMRDKLGCAEVTADGDDLCGFAEGKTYRVSAAGVRRELASVTQDDVDATFPGTAVEETGLRLLGITLESVAACADGAVLRPDGEVERLGVPRL